MIRKIVHIDEESCIGCGDCADACHEGAIEMVDGVARLIKDDYCDGLGDCLPACPADAIQIVEREASDYDEEAVAVRMASRKAAELAAAAFGGLSENAAPQAAGSCSSASPAAHTCPGSMMQTFSRSAAPSSGDAREQAAFARTESRLQQWPCQIKLVPLQAPYFDNAKLLIAADCTAFAYGSFHEDFMKDHVTLVGCPKLDFVDYSEKLAEIIKQNNIREITLARMEVPCCGGLQNALVNALRSSGKILPWQVRIISCDGRLLD